MRIAFTALLVATALTPVSGLAQTASDAPMELGEIFVSGGLTPLRFGDYGRAASIVTAEDIEDRGLSTVQEALTALPGVAVNGTSPSQAQVRIRGGEGNHTLVLIDGIEAAGGDGEYYFSGLETADIERIEVLRGPQSVFYGSNASSGVINIVTRTGGTGEHYGGSLEVGGGEAASAYYTSRDERGGVSLNLSDRHDEGFDISGDGGEKDGLDRRSFSGKGDYEITPDLTLGVVFRRVEEESQRDGTNYLAQTVDDYVINVDDSFEREEMTRSLWAEYESLGGVLTHRLSWERTDDSLSGGDAGTTETETRSYRYVMSLGLDGRPVDATKHQLNLLLEDEEDTSSSNPAYDRATQSVALEYRGVIGEALDLQAGLRYDSNDPFEDALTYTLAGSYRFGNGLRLHGSAGRGVVNPTYIELYSGEVYSGYQSNPDLVPERNRSFDIGIEASLPGGRGTIDVTYFNETLENEIAFRTLGSGLLTSVNEEGESDRQGLELEARLQATDALGLRASYTYLDAENSDGSVEIRRPKHELGLGADYAFAGGRARASGSLRYVDGLYDTRFFGDYQTVKMDSFTVADVSAQYDLTDAVTLTGRVDNLFDADYSEVLGYATRGRTAYLGVQADF